MSDVNKDGLLRIGDLVHLLRRQRADVDAAEEELSKAKEAFRRTEQEDLPSLMQELGLWELTLEDGTKLTVNEEVQAAISEENRTLAHEWLRANGFGGLIKTVVAVEFGRGEEEAARALAERIAKEDERGASIQERVHPATLKSFVKEQLEASKPVPFDLFSVHPFNRAKLEAPKVGKKTPGKRSPPGA